MGGLYPATIDPKSLIIIFLQVEVATFANGCFWGTQQIFDKYYGPTRGVKTMVGYIGGDEKFKNPSYRQVCSGDTGYAEACKVEYDPELVGYAELVGQCRELSPCSVLS